MANISDDQDVWTFSEAEETHLTTLANVACVLQQQRQPIDCTIGNCRDDENDDSASDAATDIVEVLAETNNCALKKRFLDRLAEIFSRTKVPINSVSCTAMCEEEEEDRLTVFVARNTKFEKVDVDFGRDFAACLKTKVKKSDFGAC